MMRWQIRHFLFCAPVISHVTWFVWKAWSLVQYRLTGDCGNACGWTEPYGWVPEAGCPIHDRPDGPIPPRAIGIIGNPEPGEVETAFAVIQRIKEGLDSGELVMDELESPPTDIVFRDRAVDYDLQTGEQSDETECQV